MADVALVFNNAPLAELDGREWHEFNDLTLLSVLDGSDPDLRYTGCSRIDENNGKFSDNNMRTMTQFAT